MPTPSSFPSPPPRTPPPSSSIRLPFNLFAPRLPQLGTAKTRLRTNVVALTVYIGFWWQRDLYGWVKEWVLWVICAIVVRDNGVWFVGSIETVTFSLLLWNIVEAIYAIRHASPPPTTSPFLAPPNPSLSSPVHRRLMRASLGVSPSPGGTGFNTSLSSSYLSSSSPVSTPTRQHLNSSTVNPAYGFQSSLLGRRSSETGRVIEGASLQRLISEIES